MEEDINILEEFIEDYIHEDLAIQYRVIEAIENLLKERQADKDRIKELEKLKEAHNVRINDLCVLVDAYANEYIPKSLVKEKMQQMNKSSWDKYSMSYDYIYNNGRYDAFKELLGKE